MLNLLLKIYGAGAALMMVPASFVCMYLNTAFRKDEYDGRELWAIAIALIVLWPILAPAGLVLALRWIAPGWVSLYRRVFPVRASTSADLPRTSARSKEKD